VRLCSDAAAEVGALSVHIPFDGGAPISLTAECLPPMHLRVRQTMRSSCGIFSQGAGLRSTWHSGGRPSVLTVSARATALVPLGRVRSLTPHGETVGLCDIEVRDWRPALRAGLPENTPHKATCRNRNNALRVRGVSTDESLEASRWHAPCAGPRLRLGSGALGLRAWPRWPQVMARWWSLCQIQLVGQMPRAGSATTGARLTSARKESCDRARWAIIAARAATGSLAEIASVISACSAITVRI
jgi:hypothetical protein